MSEEKPQSWSAEEEAQVADLLQQLAEVPAGDQADELFLQLERLSGAQIERSLQHWLTWYFSTCRDLSPADAQQEDPNDVSAVASLQSSSCGEVFPDADYNWCALEKVKNRDDMVKLRHLYNDLESPLRTEEEGPLAFGRVTGLSHHERVFFRKKSISDVLFHEQTEVNHLRILKDYAKVMMLPAFPPATQRSGAVVYAAAIAAALVRFDSKISSLSYQQLSDSLKGLLKRPYLVKRYRELFEAAIDKCS